MRPGDTAGTDPQDVHERIRLEANAVRALRGGDYSEIERRPALRGLLQSAMDRIETAIPASFEHESMTYYICVRLGWVELGIHATPGDAAPLVHVWTESGRWAGHRPAH